MTDPLDALRDAWRDQRPPEHGGDLHREDAATRAAVDWMRAAWNATPAPALARPRRVRRVDRWLAAAAILVATVLTVRGLPESEPTPVAPAEPVAMATPQGLELRTGSVRLLLLTPTPREATER